jgi:hypothetical protein
MPEPVFHKMNKAKLRQIHWKLPARQAEQRKFPPERVRSCPGYGYGEPSGVWRGGRKDGRFEQLCCAETLQPSPGDPP